jgi:hypothetical protein
MSNIDNNVWKVEFIRLDGSTIKHECDNVIQAEKYIHSIINLYLIKENRWHVEYRTTNNTLINREFNTKKLAEKYYKHVLKNHFPNFDPLDTHVNDPIMYEIEYEPAAKRTKENKLNRKERLDRLLIEWNKHYNI